MYHCSCLNLWYTCSLFVEKIDKIHSAFAPFTSHEIPPFKNPLLSFYFHTDHLLADFSKLIPSSNKTFSPSDSFSSKPSPLIIDNFFAIWTHSITYIFSAVQFLKNSHAFITPFGLHSYFTTSSFDTLEHYFYQPFSYIYWTLWFCIKLVYILRIYPLNPS